MRNILRKRVVVAVALGTVAFAASTGVAATTLLTNGYADEQGTYHACVQGESGNVRMIVPDAVCRENESAVDWNRLGPAGPRGPAGPQGEPGRLASLEALEGLACRVGQGDGTVVLTGGGAPGVAAATYTIACLRADEFEPNDTRGAAVDVTSRVSSGAMGAVLNLGIMTVYPAGDEDWFIVRATAFRSIQAPFGVRLDIYRDGELVAQDLELLPPSGGSPLPPAGFFNDVGGPHDWEFHIKRGSAPSAFYFLNAG